MNYQKEKRNKNTTRSGGLCFWWETACTNRAENKQEFSDLLQRVKEFKGKWLNTKGCDT